MQGHEEWHPLAKLGVKTLGSGALAAGFVGLVYGAVRPALEAKAAQREATGSDQILHVSRSYVHTTKIDQHRSLHTALRDLSVLCDLATDSEQAKLRLRRLVTLFAQMLHQSVSLHNATTLRQVLQVLDNLSLLSVKIDRYQMRLQSLLLPTVGKTKVHPPSAKLGQFVRNFIARESTVANDLRSALLSDPNSMADMDQAATAARAAGARVPMAVTTAAKLKAAFSDPTVVGLREALGMVLSSIEARQAGAAKQEEEEEVQANALECHAKLSQLVRQFEKLHRGGLDAASRQRLRVKAGRRIKWLAYKLAFSAVANDPLYRLLADAVTTFEDMEVKAPVAPAVMST